MVADPGGQAGGRVSRALLDILHSLGVLRIDPNHELIGEGLDLAEVRGKLQEAKAAVVALEAQLAAVTGHRAPIDRDQLARRVADWREVLRRGPALARQILRKILPDKLALFPTDDGVAFRSAATYAGLLMG